MGPSHLWVLVSGPENVRGALAEMPLRSPTLASVVVADLIGGREVRAGTTLLSKGLRFLL